MAAVCGTPLWERRFADLMVPYPSMFMTCEPGNPRLREGRTETHIEGTASALPLPLTLECTRASTSENIR